MHGLSQVPGLERHEFEDLDGLEFDGIAFRDMDLMFEIGFIKVRCVSKIHETDFFKDDEDVVCLGTEDAGHGGFQQRLFTMMICLSWGEMHRVGGDSAWGIPWNSSRHDK